MKTAAVLFLGIISTCTSFKFANADVDSSSVPAKQGTNPPPSNSSKSVPMVDSCILIGIRPEFFTQMVDPIIIASNPLLKGMQTIASQNPTQWQCNRKEIHDETSYICCCTGDSCKNVSPQLGYSSSDLGSMKWDAFGKIMTAGECTTPLWAIALLSGFGTGFLIFLILFFVLLTYTFGWCCFANRKKDASKKKETVKAASPPPTVPVPQKVLPPTALPISDKEAEQHSKPEPAPSKPEKVQPKARHSSSKAHCHSKRVKTPRKPSPHPPSKTPLESTDYSSGQNKKNTDPYTLMALADFENGNFKQQFPNKEDKK